VTQPHENRRHLSVSCQLVPGSLATISVDPTDGCVI